VLVAATLPIREVALLPVPQQHHDFVTCSFLLLPIDANKPISPLNILLLLAPPINTTSNFLPFHSSIFQPNPDTPPLKPHIDIDAPNQTITSLRDPPYLTHLDSTCSTWSRNKDMRTVCTVRGDGGATVQYALIQEVEECPIDCSAVVGERRGRYVHLDAFLITQRESRVSLLA
jgi:hypothetical protein